MRMDKGFLGASCAARRAVPGLSTLLAAGLALAASPALSQGAMGPGGGAMTPQPRVAPAPQAPTGTQQAPVVTPQMPPQLPVVAPIPSTAQPGPTNQPGKANAQGSDFVNVESSNRNYIKRDVQPDSTGSPGGPQKTLRVINNSEMDTATVDAQFSKTPGAPAGPANPVASKAEQPIPSVNVMVRKQSGAGAISTAKTDGNGQTTFRQLEPGTYDVALPSVPGASVSMTTFVNGTPAARTDFPAGSTIGTFTVGSASDTVILKFQTNLGTTPVNGIGGTGGGRFQTNLGSTPSNGVGGTGGGRYTFK